MKIIITSLQINIKLKSEMPVQIDGEPWMQPPGNVIVRPILTLVFTVSRRCKRLLFGENERLVIGLAYLSVKNAPRTFRKINLVLSFYLRNLFIIIFLSTFTSKNSIKRI